MTKTEEIAKAFIDARRKKIIAKRKRADCICDCQYKNGDRRACVFVYDLPEEKWCERCKESRIHNKEFHLQTSKASGLLRRLENAVASL